MRASSDHGVVLAELRGREALGHAARVAEDVAVALGLVFDVQREVGSRSGLALLLMGTPRAITRQRRRR